jgi:HAD superfamily hydrolase (TIGR01509 family)
VNNAPKTLHPAVVFFDLGMVVVDVDIVRARTLWSQMTGRDGHTFDDIFFGSGIKDAMDVGTINGPQALAQAELLCGGVVSQAELLKCWNAILATRPRVSETIRQVGSIARCAVISNTDPLHARFIEEHCGIADIIEHWTYSFDTRSMKPEPEILNYALNKLGVAGSQALLVDDRRDNLATAATLGMDTVYFENIAQVRQALFQRGLLASL